MTDGGFDGDDVIEIIDELGRRLEGPAKHVFELAVRQVYVEAIPAFLLFVALSAILIVAGRYYYKLIKGGGDILDSPFPVFMGTIFGGVAWIPVFVTAIDTVPALLNPEWRAIEMIGRTLLP